MKEFDYKVRKRIYFLDKEADHNYLSKLYKISDVYLHTSSYEGFGAVLAEASLSGLPVVSTKNDGCMDIIENKKSGFIVKSSSNKVIAKYVIKLLKNESLRKKMGLYGQSRALEKYSVIKNLEKRDKLWKNVMNIWLDQSKKSVNKNWK